MDAANEYYNKLQENEEEYRKKIFVENNTYEDIESAIIDIIGIGDKNRDHKINYEDLKNSRKYKDTYKFLEQLAPYSEGKKNEWIMIIKILKAEEQTL